VISTDDPGVQAWRTLLRSHAAIVRELDAAMEQEAGMSVRAYEVLVRLAHVPGGSLRMAELANSVYLSPSGITRLVDQLVRRGLVTRRKDPNDARSYLAELTKRGQSSFERASVVYRGAVQTHFAQRLSTEQLLSISEILGAFAEGLPRRAS